MKLMKFVLFALVLFAALALITSCSPKAAGVKPDNVDYYTCSMHPSYRSQQPGDKCPICGMNLVPVFKKKAASETNGAPGSARNTAATNSEMKIIGHDHAAMLAGRPASNTAAPAGSPGEFVVPIARQQMIGIGYAIVEEKTLQRTVRVAGEVTYDKQRHWDYVSRVDGYVQSLKVFSRGEPVKKGQALMTLYSPDLLTTENEFLDMVRLRDEARKSHSETALASAEQMVASSRRRLHLWNISDEEIDSIEKSRQATEILTLYSPFAGVVQDLGVDQGRKVSPGDHLVDVADLSSVWVWADFYQEELSYLKKGLPVTITSSAIPGETFSGTISLIDPFLNDAKRTGRVRVDVKNPGQKLRPSMYVDIDLELNGGTSLAIPADAILPTGRRNVVFVSKGEGKLEPRFVELGGRFGTNQVVKSGLQRGEKVVSRGNFLIDAEAKIQGALKDWGSVSEE